MRTILNGRSAFLELERADEAFTDVGEAVPGRAASLKSVTAASIDAVIGVKQKAA